MTTKRTRMIQRSLRTLAAATSLVAAGCGADAQDVVDGDDAVGVTSAALGEASCATAPGGLQFAGGANVRVYPYSNPSCYKSMLVTVTNYSAAYLGSGDIPGGTDIRWVDARQQGGPALPTTQAACTKIWLGAYVYRWTGTSWTLVGKKGARGTWQSGLGGCTAPDVTFTSATLSAGQTYKFAASARMDNTDAAAIAGLEFVSHPPTRIH